MKMLILVLLAAMLCMSVANAQTDSTIDLYIAHDSFLVQVQQDSDHVVPIFADTNINNIINKYTFTKFEKAVPFSRFPGMHQIYSVVCDNTLVAEELKTSFPEIFPQYGVTPPPVPHSTRYTPNDWTGSAYTDPWALDYINAREAWSLQDVGISGARGNPSVIIGITDTYFDLTHPDLMYKIVYADETAASGSTSHGSATAGAAAGHTDNGVGYPGVGFNCMLRVSTVCNSNAMLQMSLPLSWPPQAKVLNASWGPGSPTLDFTSGTITNRIKFDEIYENGVVTCASAGNGKNIFDPSNRPWYFCVPASYDHVISTTHIGNKNCSWIGDGTGSGLYCDEHNVIHDDTMSIDPSVGTDLSADNFNHNTRVDICAPAHKIGGIIYNPSASGDARYYTNEISGTSFASPMTAGVIGLMASVNSCLSPYQLEYLLKRSARDEIYSVPDNAYFASPPRLGAGALNAHEAVLRANAYDCNTQATQTFYIAGVEINTLCAPGYSSNGVKPVLKPILVNGTPPYTYRWELFGGTAFTSLDHYDIANPTIINPPSASNLAWYYLTVYDNSPIQKVANKWVKVQLTTANTYDLASRDSYVDMMGEPNTQAIVDPREGNYWLSPDIWNRLANDGGLTPQNVEYFSSGAPNYMNVRIRNVGCANYSSTDNAVVRAYWTVASTGEWWAFSWTSFIMPADAGGTLPGGLEINPTSPTAIPNLAPGAEFIATIPWNPVNPRAYLGTPSSVGICALARIEEPTKSMDGMAFYEGTNTTTNVKNNNNIVTRNMQAVNLGRKKAPTSFTRWMVGNAGQYPATFSFQMIRDRDIHLHFAGNPSEYMYVSLKLEDGLWHAWENGGFQGNYATKNANTKTVTYDPSSPLRLDGISLDTGARFNIDGSFVLRDEIPINVPLVS